MKSNKLLFKIHSTVLRIANRQIKQFQTLFKIKKYINKKCHIRTDESLVDLSVSDNDSQKNIPRHINPDPTHTVAGLTWVKDEQ